MGRKTRQKQNEARARYNRYSCAYSNTTKRQESKENKRYVNLVLDWLPKPYRPFEDYIPNSHNIDTRSINCLRFMYCKYHVPKWLLKFVYDKILYFEREDNERRYRTWESYKAVDVFKDKSFTLSTKLLQYLGNGTSARELLKPYLSKTEFSFFISQKEIPVDNLLSFFIYCKAITKGLNKPAALLLTRLSKDLFEAHNYSDYFECISQFAYFCAKEDANAESVNDMFDFMKNTGNFLDFNYKGRTVQSILNLAIAWHEEINKREAARQQAKLDTIYTERKVLEWIWANKDGSQVATVTQVKTYKELVQEGRAQHNCVAAYHGDCCSERCAIFSMKLNGMRLLTIEVKGNQVVQARGVCNRSPKESEKKLLAKWCTAVRLTNRTI